MFSNSRKSWDLAEVLLVVPLWTCIKCDFICTRQLIPNETPSYLTYCTSIHTLTSIPVQIFCIFALSQLSHLKFCNLIAAMYLNVSVAILWKTQQKLLFNFKAFQQSTNALVHELIRARFLWNEVVAIFLEQIIFFLLPFFLCKWLMRQLYLALPQRKPTNLAYSR